MSSSILKVPYSQRLEHTAVATILIRSKPNGDVVHSAREHIVKEFFQAVAQSLADRLLDAHEKNEVPQKSDTKVKSEAVKAIASHYDVTQRTLWRWLERKDDLETKPRSGRPAMIDNKVKKAIVDECNQSNGKTIRATAVALEVAANTIPTRRKVFSTTYRGKTRNAPSKTSCHKVMQEGQILSIKQRPRLTKENEEVRYNFAMQQTALSFEERNEHVCALDEAWIVAFKSGTGKRVHHECGAPVRKKLSVEVKNKRHPDKIMVLAVIALPRMLNKDSAGRQGTDERAQFCSIQNGKVALVRCVAEEKYKKKVTRIDDGERVTIHEKGDTKVVSVTIDSSRYKDFLDREDGVLDRIRDYFGPDILVKLQEDGAPGHGYNNKNNRAPNAIHNELEQVAASMDITIFKQPHNSPELNPLDLGIWHSIQSKVKHMDLPASHGFDSNYVETQIWAAAKQAWAELESRTIWNCWMVKDEILKMLVANHGKRIDREPHVGVRQYWGTYE